MSREQFDKSSSDDKAAERWVAEFVKAGGAVSHQNGEVHIRFGRTDTERESLNLPMTTDKTYRPNAIGHIRDTYGLAKEFDPKKDSEEFLKAKGAGVEK